MVRAPLHGTASRNRITECSRFAARHVPGAIQCESYALWGDVPLLMPVLPRGKMAKSGMRPDLRAEIPPALADWIADNFTRHYNTVACLTAPAPQ